jgi:hypothetical protein
MGSVPGFRLYVIPIVSAEAAGFSGISVAAYARLLTGYDRRDHALKMEWVERPAIFHGRVLRPGDFLP